MIYLINYELKKIIKNKVNIWTISICLISIMGYILITSLDTTYIDTNNNQLRGLEAINLEKKDYSKLRGELSEERISDIITRYKEITSKSENITSNGDMTIEAYFKYWKLYSPISDLIDRSYSSISAAGNNMVSSLISSDSQNFYKNKILQTEDYINNHSSIKLSNSQKILVMNKVKEISKPLFFQYNKGWFKLLWDMNIINVIMLVCVCICISPVYASEYDTEADAILLCTKYGRDKLNSAKIISSSLFVILVYFIFSMMAAILRLGIYGFVGWNSKIQTNATYWHSIYNINFLQAILLSMLVGIISSLVILSIVLFISSRSSNIYTTIIISVTLLILPKFLNFSDSYNVIGKIFDLLPINAAFIANFLGYYKYYNVLGIDINYMTMYVVTSIFIFPIFIYMAYKTFLKHQIA